MFLFWNHDSLEKWLIPILWYGKYKVSLKHVAMLYCKKSVQREIDGGWSNGIEATLMETLISQIWDNMSIGRSDSNSKFNKYIFTSSW